MTQLAFPFQVALAVVVVLPVCWGVADLLDRGVDVAVARRTRRSDTRRPGDGP